MVATDPVENAGAGFQLHFELLLFHPMTPGRVGVAYDWSHFNGVLLSLHFACGKSHTIQGTAVMVAPGFALTASHVVAPWEEALRIGSAEMACVGIVPSGLLFWNVRQVTMVENCDVTILALSLGSALPPDNRFNKVVISTRLPNLSETVMIGGFRAAAATFEAGHAGIQYSFNVKSCG